MEGERLMPSSRYTGKEARITVLHLGKFIENEVKQFFLENRKMRYRIVSLDEFVRCRYDGVIELSFNHVGKAYVNEHFNSLNFNLNCTKLMAAIGEYLCTRLKDMDLERNSIEIACTAGGYGWLQKTVQIR